MRAMRKRPRRNNLSAPEPLEDVLRKSGEQRFSKVVLPIAHRVWRDAVGSRIAMRATPVTLVRGTLWVRVSTSGWASELGFLADAIVERLRAAGVACDRLRFRVGEVEHFERPPERRVVRKVPQGGPIPEGLAEIIDAVEDADLAELIRGAASVSLAIAASSQSAKAPRGAGTGIGLPDRKPPHTRESGPRTPGAGPRRGS